MIDLTFNKDEQINAVIGKAIEYARKYRTSARFVFKDVTVVVNGDSDPAIIYRDWFRATQGFLGETPTVGPGPHEEFSEEEEKAARESLLKLRKSFEGADDA